MVNSNDLEDAVAKIVKQKIVREKYELIAQLIVKKARLLLQANIGKKTDRALTLKYEIKEDTITIYSDDEVLGYIEEGTKPHIIRPKAGKALKFTALRAGNRSNGEHFGAGSTILAKEVHHPGTDARPFLSQAVFLSKTEIKQILAD